MIERGLAESLDSQMARPRFDYDEMDFQFGLRYRDVSAESEKGIVRGAAVRDEKNRLRFSLILSCPVMHLPKRIILFKTSQISIRN